MNFSLKNVASLLVLAFTFLLINCSKENTTEQPSPATPKITVTGTIVSFGSVDVLSQSSVQDIDVSGNALKADLIIKASSNFKVSLDATTFSSEVTIAKDDANAGATPVYVVFAPLEDAIGQKTGNLSFQSTGASIINLSLSGEGLNILPLLSLDASSLNFEATVDQVSDVQNITIDAENLTTAIAVSATDGFEISLDNVTFTNTLQIAANVANGDTLVYVRFSPTEIGDVSGTLSFSNTEATDVSASLEGVALPVIDNYKTFDKQPLAHNGGYTKKVDATFTLAPDLDGISQIKMYLQIDCPSGGCDDWDRFANVRVKDPNSNAWYEIGRYVTPYWVGTQQLDRGLEFDVTDFKSMLTGQVQLRIFVENWTSKADLISVDFDYIHGTPDYPYYKVSQVLGYHWGAQVVPYGEAHTYDLDKQITLPANTESSHLRTIITGWGHADQSAGANCAEWCFRTHNVKIDGTNTFEHYLGPLGCASNPLNNQSPGNWTPDRAGWCPGMEVPVRKDQLNSNLSGTTFSFAYEFEDWTNTFTNGKAYYAISTYVVVKSNTPISRPTID